MARLGRLVPGRAPVSEAAGPEAARDQLPDAPPPHGTIRRAMDLWLGALALVASAPLVVGAVVAMRLTGDHGPVLYRAPRVGERLQPFMALKIRTMRPGVGGTRVTLSADPRVTRVGRVLRHYRIDELPQLVNVLRGEMALVGPRPEDPRYVDPTDPLHRFVFGARPGITGPTQLTFRAESELFTGSDPEAAYRERVLPEKLAMDAAYLRRRTLASDLAILGRTVAVILPHLPRTSRRA